MHYWSNWQQQTVCVRYKVTDSRIHKWILDTCSYVCLNWREWREWHYVQSRMYLNWISRYEYTELISVYAYVYTDMTLDGGVIYYISFIVWAVYLEIEMLYSPLNPVRKMLDSWFYSVHLLVFWNCIFFSKEMVWSDQNYFDNKLNESCIVRMMTHLHISSDCRLLSTSDSIFFLKYSSLWLIISKHWLTVVKILWVVARNVNDSPYKKQRTF